MVRQNLFPQGNIITRLSKSERGIIPLLGSRHGSSQVSSTCGCLEINLVRLFHSLASTSCGCLSKFQALTIGSSKGVVIIEGESVAMRSPFFVPVASYKSVLRLYDNLLDYLDEGLSALVFNYFICASG